MSDSDTEFAIRNADGDFYNADSDVWVGRKGVFSTYADHDEAEVVIMRYALRADARVVKLKGGIETA